MLNLTIFNTICNFIIIIALICYFIYKNFYISWNRTFWMKKIYGFNIMKRDSKTSGHGLIFIKLKDPEKMNKWDSEQFHNGNYSKSRTN